MQLAILHYHLNAGGVTKVVQNHLQALCHIGKQAPQRVWLLHGGRALGWPHQQLAEQLPFPCELLTVEGLDYDDTTASPTLAKGIAAALRSVGASPSDTLLHWHNHALGKNVSAPLAVARLAGDGYRTLLQIHDFAEDFRPSNYHRLTEGLAGGDAHRLPALLYPQAEHIHYATLNGRDFGILHRAGVASDRLHLLPNPVARPPIAAGTASARRQLAESLGLATNTKWWTCPVRGIRRKNLGELLLWSAVTNDTWFFLTLAPQNPVERAPFERWSKFAREQNLPCRFGSPAEHAPSFGQILAASDALVTTSVAEGFGMVYLEAWLAGRELLGRDLPEITGDFTALGLDLSQLYSELAIPTEWIDRREYLERVGSVVRETYGSFGVEAPVASELENQLAVFLEAPTIDFAYLPSKVQRDVIRRVVASDRDRERVLEGNPGLQPERGDSEARIAANAAVVRQHFSLANLGQQLATIYAKVCQSRPQHDLLPPSQGEAVFESLLRVDRLHPLRVEP